MRNDNALMKRPCNTLDCIARLNPPSTRISKPPFTTRIFAPVLQYRLLRDIFPLKHILNLGSSDSKVTYSTAGGTRTTD
jgi:hypothetical protein